MLKINVKNICESTFVIIGTIIGAGFASGQEIYTFFNIYGIEGIFGLILSISFIGIIVYKTFKIILNDDINTYQEFLNKIMPNKLKDNKILCYTISNIINIFLFISFNIMVAGFATYFIQELNISKWYGAIIIAIMAFITFYKNINGVVKINTYLIPMLIVLIIFLGIRKTNNLSIIEINQGQKTLYWILSSILYASYNSITLIPILISLKKYIKTNKEAKTVSTFTIIVMIALSVTIFLLMNLFMKEIANVEIPIIYIANTLGKGFNYIYGITVLIAIFTTAISAGYSFLCNITNSKRKYTLASLVICIFSIFAGQLGFSNLINMLYPIFGYLGIIQIIFLLIA